MAARNENRREASNQLDPGPAGGAPQPRIFGQVAGRCRLNRRNPMMTAPGTKRLKLKYEETLSNVAFKFNLWRYKVVQEPQSAFGPMGSNGEENVSVRRCRLSR